MSFAQHRLWFLSRLSAASHAYNEAIMVHLDELADPAVLEACLTEIVRRHEAWRTVFLAVDGEPRQRIEPPRPFHLEVVDLRPQHADEREPTLHHLAVEHARRPFALETGPLVRALLLLGERESRLVVTAHHIVVDGISFFSVFLPELSLLYAAFSRNQPSPLPELALHHADFASWQRRRLEEAVLAPELAYWRAQLSGTSELALPADFPRPATPTERGARVPIALSTELARALRAHGRRAGVSLFTTLLAAWKTLLYRYTGQRDVIVGSAAAGRPLPELEGMIGYFSNNLVLRTQLDETCSFLELLPKVGEVLRGAREHQDVPFERLVSELGANRDPYKNPVYDNVFILMPPLPRLEGTPLRGSRFDIGVAKVALYLELHQRPSGLEGHLEYQTDRFAESTIERMVGHFQTLLESIAGDPTQRLSELPLLTAAEQRRLSGWQGPAVDAPPESERAGLEALFEAQAARSPEAIALEHGDRRLTYAELDARANRLAHRLRAQGVGPEILVGLYLERSIEAMVAILGVLKAGGAYVPLDLSWPSERLRFIMEDAGLQIVLASSARAGEVSVHGVRAVFVDEDREASTLLAVDSPLPRAAASDLAYVIYTSGSTGRPKGVMVERRGLHDLARAQQQMFGLKVGSRVLQFFSLHFDGSVWELTMAWSAGATLVLADRDALLPGPGLVELLRQQSIHAVLLTPSALSVMPAAALPELRVLVAGGEALSEEIVARWAPGRRFFNAYGPTEATVVATVAECRAGEGKPSIGRPLDHVAAYILDGGMRPVPAGIPGELYLGGPCLARGYLGRPALSAERFVENPSPQGGARVYKTGDLARWRPDGTIEYLGRTDHQIKLRGFRIELEEIEAEIARHPGVELAAVKLLEEAGEPRLAGYYVPRAGAPADLERALPRHLRERLPAYMIPSLFVRLERMPWTSSGKIDRAALPAPSTRPRSGAPARGAFEQVVASIWGELLGVSEIDPDASFFEIGGHSLALARVQARLQARLGADVDLVTLLRLPTIRQLAAHLQTLPGRGSPPAAERGGPVATTQDRATAIVGMAIRAPGVHGPEELWQIVVAGRDTIRTFDPEALVAAGADPARVHRPDFVPAEGVLEDADRFDAGFFGFSDADAAIMDPQQRLFLECAHEALERAGCDPLRGTQRIGVFAGAGAPLHWLGPVADAVRTSGSGLDTLRAHTLNAPDFLASRVAFKLGLRGPAVTVQTACSTSLSAVHLARQSLLAGECDVALAGGVTLAALRDADRGHVHEGGLLSADGHCRPFDVHASGTVRSSGAAIVVLKRLSDALRDGDTIHAVVIGSAMTNDGASKIGFTAPSEDGIAETVQRAYETAGIDPRTVGLVEAHGTATRLGDPLEVRAFTRAYRRWTEDRGFCALGSVKANLGHVDAAAGAASLIKAALAVEHGIIPPIAGFTAPNPLLDLERTPFFAPAAPRPWPATGAPRRASVNALGIGGTNVHVVLEEAPPPRPARAARPGHVLCLSAKTPSALAESARRLGDHLEAHPALELADVAFTLATGRSQHRYRAAITGRDRAELRAALASHATPELSGVGSATASAGPVVFLFPGHGAHYARMGLEVYEAQPVFRSEVDRCFDLVRRDAGLEVRGFWLGEAAAPGEELALTHALLFTIEYALARQLLVWGVRPAALLGHSLGEYVAACIAGVFSLPDALALVVARGRLAETTPPGAMLVAFADARAIEPRLDAGVTIATYAPGSVVLTGLAAAVERAGARLASAGVETTAVPVAHAGHSPVMRGVREAFRRRVAAVERRAPEIPLISNMTGLPITAEQAMSPDYWADHLCSPVRLEDGFGALLELGAPLCLEVGPGGSLSALLRRHARWKSAGAIAAGTLPDHRRRETSAHDSLLRGLGRAWESGVEIDWNAFHAHEERRRIPLPAYPFERRSFTLGATPHASAGELDALEARTALLARELGVRGVDDCPGLRPRLTAVCASLVLDFFAGRLGGDLDRTFSPDALQARAGIHPKHAPMLHHLVQLLEREGLASRTTSGEVRFRTEHAGRSRELSARLSDELPESKGLIRFVTHCVGCYDAVLCGDADGLAAVYPDGTNAFHQECTHHMGPPRWHVYASLMREVVLDLVARRRGRKTRILEIAAGHGLCTWPLVERLGGEDVEYHFTDIGRSLLLRADAQIERRGLSWMKTRRFDLNRSPREQGMVEPYDVILGLGAIHVAADPRGTLANLRSLLVPGGSLLFVETTRIEPWEQLAMALFPGFWDLEHNRDFSLDLARWESLVRGAGFSSVASVPRDPRSRGSTEFGLVIARRALAAGPERAAAPPAPVKPDGGKDGGDDPVERLWKRLLGKSRAPADASFFDLGGDSLLAVQLLAELRLQTGLHITPRQFAGDPTLRGLKALLGAAGEPEVRSTAPPEPPPAAAPGVLVPLHPGGAKRPLFLVHPIGGSALCYAHLAKAIDPDRPVYGVQSPMLAGHAMRPGSIEEMAACYVDAISRVQPEGPYLVGGWSFGGMLAAEVARQLRLRGRRVGQLVLFDAIASPRAWLALLHRIDPRWAAVSMLPSIFGRRGIEAMRRSEADDITALASLLGAASQNLVVYEHHLSLWRRHALAELDVPAVHFVPEKRTALGALFLASRARALRIPSMSTSQVPGDHFSILSAASAGVLGARLKDVLDGAERSSAPGATRDGAEASVHAFLEQYVDSVRRRDAESLGGIFADECVNVTTGESIFVGSAPIKQHYVRRIPELLDVRIRVHDWRVIVLPGGRTACAVGRVDSDQTFVEGQRRVIYQGARVSLVLVWQSETWRVVHSHISLPAGGHLEAPG